MSSGTIEALTEKFGPHLHGLFRIIGFYDVYHTRWFNALLSLFAVNNLACLLLRGRLRLRSLGFVLTHISIVAIAVGVLMRVHLGEKGTVRIGVKQTIDQFQDRKGRMVDLGFKVHLSRFTLERYGEAEEALRAEVVGQGSLVDFPVRVGSMFHVGETDYDVRILRYEPDFFIDMETRKVASRSDQPNNPALQVQIDQGDATRKQWIFAKFPGQTFDKQGKSSLRLTYLRSEGGPIKDYKSELVVTEADREVARKTIVVNDPLTYKGYTFYQSSYDTENHKWSGLQVAKDPGVPAVYAGFLLMVLGMTFSYCIKPYLGKRTQS